MRTIFSIAIFASATAVLGLSPFGGNTVFETSVLADDLRDSAIKPRVCRLPKVEEITSMVAEAYCHPLGGSDVPQFEVPRELYAEVLKHFEESEAYDKVGGPLDGCEIGSIRMKLEYGCVRICWFMVAAKVNLHFSCDGRRYIHVGKQFAEDENLTMYAYIAQMQHVEQDKADAEKKRSSLTPSAVESPGSTSIQTRCGRVPTRASMCSLRPVATAVGY